MIQCHDNVNNAINTNIFNSEIKIEVKFIQNREVHINKIDTKK